MHSTCQILNIKRRENRTSFALLCGLTRNLWQCKEKHFLMKSDTCEAISFIILASRITVGLVLSVKLQRLRLLRSVPQWLCTV